MVAPAQLGQIRLVDCDVHPTFKNGIRDLERYFPPSWRAKVFGDERYKASEKKRGMHPILPINPFYLAPGGGSRKDAVTSDGDPAGSNPKIVAAELLDRYKIDRAILLGNNMLSINCQPNADLAAAICSAYNDWLSETWLEADTRYRGAIVVAPQDPVKASEEIKRCANRPGMACVMLPLTTMLMGDRYYFPIYEAAHTNQLPIAVHISGTEGIFAKGPLLAGGIPSYYLDWHASLSGVYLSNAISLIAHGVFEKFPDLRVIMTEAGMGWILDVMWNMDKLWKSTRDETPWVKRLPSEYLRDHLRLSTQPFVDPARREHITAFCEMTGADQMLMFSSDHPHWDFDDPRWVLKTFSEGAREKVAYSNALAVYGERLA